MKRVLLLLLIMVIILFATAPPAQSSNGFNTKASPEKKMTVPADNGSFGMMTIATVANADQNIAYAPIALSRSSPGLNAGNDVAIGKINADGLALNTGPDYYFLNPQNTDALTESGYSSTYSAKTADLDVSGIRLCAFKNEATMADNGLTARLSRH